MKIKHVYNLIIYNDMLKIASTSLRSRRLEVVGTRKNGHARRRQARGVSPSRALVLPLAHYFQAPATQAMLLHDMVSFLRTHFAKTRLNT